MIPIKSVDKHGCPKCAHSDTCLFKPNWNNNQHDTDKYFLNPLIVENPRLSWQIFDTFMHTDVFENETHVFLDHMEPCEDLNQFENAHVRPFSPLETIYIYGKKELCTHPVVETLINVKLKSYAKIPIVFDVLKQLCLTVVWTIFACCEDYSLRHWYSTGSSSFGGKVSLLIFCIIFFAWDMVDELSTLYYIYKRMKGQQKWLRNEVSKQQSSMENGISSKYMLIKKVKKMNKDTPSPLRLKNVVNFMPLGPGLATLVSHFIDIGNHTDYNARIRIIIACLNVVLAWLRQLLLVTVWFVKTDFMPQMANLVCMLRLMGADILHFVLLFIRIYIPFLFLYWALFTGPKLSESTMKTYYKECETVLYGLPYNGNYNLTGFSGCVSNVQVNGFTDFYAAIYSVF